MLPPAFAAKDEVDMVLDLILIVTLTLTLIPDIKP